MKLVAQNGPQKTRLGTFGIAQQLQPLTGRFLEHTAHHLVGLATNGHVIAFALSGSSVKTQDVAAHLLVEPGAGFLAKVAHAHELGQHRRGGKVAVERVGLQTQVVLQRLDDMGHGVQAHHVCRTERTRTRAAHLLAGEVVHHVVSQAKILHLLHGRQHARDANAVGDEVGCVMGPHHTFAQHTGDERLQIVQHGGLGGGRIDQLHQCHVARWVEKVDAAKTWLDGLGQGLAEFGDRQARGVGRHDGVGCQVRGDSAVQVELPVHAFSNRFDHQVTVLELLQMLLVVCLADQRGVLRHPQRRGLELFQALHRLADDAILRPLFGRQVEHHHRHSDVDQMCSNLRTHDACAEHGDLFDLETLHGPTASLPRSGCAQTARWTHALPAFCRLQLASASSRSSCRSPGRESCRLPTCLCRPPFWPHG